MSIVNFKENETIFPTEILQKIFLYLDKEDLNKMKSACILFDKIINSNSFKISYKKIGNGFLKLDFVSIRKLNGYVHSVLIDNRIIISYQKIKYSKVQCISFASTKMEHLIDKNNGSIDYIKFENDDHEQDFSFFGIFNQGNFIYTGSDYFYNINDNLYSIDLKTNTKKIVNLQGEDSNYSVFKCVLINNYILCTIGCLKDSCYKNILFYKLNNNEIICKLETDSLDGRIVDMKYINNKLLILTRCYFNSSPPNIQIYSIDFPKNNDDVLKCYYVKSICFSDYDMKLSYGTFRFKVYIPKKIVFNINYTCVLFNQLTSGSLYEDVKLKIFKTCNFEYLKEIKIHVLTRDLLYLFKYCKNVSIFEKYLIILLTYNLLIINIETGEQRILYDYFNSDFNLGEGGKDYVFSDFVIHKNGYGQSFLIALIQNVINNDKNLITFKIQ